MSPLGRISEALSDLTKAIQLQPSARLYRHRGTLYFISEVSRFEGSCLVLVVWVFLLLSFVAFSTSCYCCSRASSVFKWVNNNESPAFSVYNFPAVQRYYSVISSMYLFNAESSCMVFFNCTSLIILFIWGIGYRYSLFWFITYSYVWAVF